jgi:hypothetical protein
MDRIGGRVDELFILSSNDKIWDINILINDVSINRYTFSESITDPSNHTAFDIVGDNHATLINGSLANEGVQDEFHWGQNGYGEFIGVETVSNDNINLPERFGQDIVQYTGVLTIGQSIGGRNCIKATANGLECHYFNDKTTDYDKKWILEGEIYIPSTSNVTKVGIGRALILPAAGGGGSRTLYDERVGIVESKDTWVNTAVLWNRNAVFNNWHHHVDVDGGGYGVDAVYYFRNLQLREYDPNIITPASAALDGTDALGNPLTVTQSGGDFLDACKLEHYDYPAIRKADAVEFERNCFQGDDSGACISQNTISYPTNYELELDVNAFDPSVLSHLVDIRSSSSDGLRVAVGQLPNTISINLNDTSAFTISRLGGDENIRVRVYGGNAYYNINNAGDVLFKSSVSTPLDSYVSLGGRSFSTVGENVLKTGQLLLNIRFKQLDASGNFVSELNRWSLSEPITAPSTHIYKDTVAGNDASLVAGSLANNGRVTVTNNFWFNDGEPRQKAVGDFDGIQSNQIFSDIFEADKVTDIRTHKAPLEARQLNTEKVITNNN